MFIHLLNKQAAKFEDNKYKFLFVYKCICKQHRILYEKFAD